MQQLPRSTTGNFTRDWRYQRARAGLWSRLSIVTKVMLVANLLLAAAVTLAGVLTYRFAASAIRQQIIISGQDIVGGFAEMNALDLLDEEQGTFNLQLRLNKLLAKDVAGRIRSAFVLDAQNEVLAAKNREDPVPVVAGRVTDAVGVFEHPDQIHIASAIIYEKTTLGYVVFGFDKSLITSAARSILGRTAVVVLLALGVNVVLIILVLRRLLKPIGELGRAARRFVRGDYTYRIHGKIPHDEIGEAATSFNAMCDELEVHLKFSNAALIDRIRRGEATDEGREYQLSIVFGDASSYTQWSQLYAPREVFEMLTRYYTCIGALTVQRFNGIIDKFMGDGVMAHFGLLRRDSDASLEHVRDSLRATVYSQIALRVLAQSIQRYEKREPLTYRFGIASGRCLVGAVGARDIKLDFSLIGNVVNLASRLEGRATGGGILIDRFTQLDAGEDFLVVKDCGAQQIKGIDRPIQTYAVGGFAKPVETQAMQAYLLDQFFTNERIETLFLDGKGTRERVAEVRAMAEAELRDRPSLPI